MKPSDYFEHDGGTSRRCETCLGFVANTRIETVEGPRAARDLRVGDMVITKDMGPQPLTWIDHTVSAHGTLAPILIRRNALSNSVDLLISPGCLVLYEGWKAELLFGCSSVLVQAKSVVNEKDIYQVPNGNFAYTVFMFENQQLVMAGGIWFATYYPANVNTIPDAAQMNPICHTSDFECKQNIYDPLDRPILRNYEATLIT